MLGRPSARKSIFTSTSVQLKVSLCLSASERVSAKKLCFISGCTRYLAGMLQPLMASLSSLARPAQTAGRPVQHAYTLPGLSPAGHAASASHAHLLHAPDSGRFRRHVETRVATLVLFRSASMGRTSPVQSMLVRNRSVQQAEPELSKIEKFGDNKRLQTQVR